MAVSIHSFIGASTRCVPCVHAAWRGVARGSLCISVGFGSGSALVYSFSYRGGHCVLAFLCSESFRVLSLAFAFRLSIFSLFRSLSIRARCSIDAVSVSKKHFYPLSASALDTLPLPLNNEHRRTCNTNTPIRI